MPSNETDKTRSEKTKPELVGIPPLFEDKGFMNFDDSKHYKAHKTSCIKFVFAERPEKQSLVLTGKVGTGKTHLAIAILKNLRPVQRRIRNSRIESVQGIVDEQYSWRTERARGLFLVCDEFFQELNDCAVSKQSKLNVINKYLDIYDMVVLDDLNTFNWTNAKQENLYLFVNRAYLNKKRIIITTNFSMEELQQLDERITSRLKEMAKILDFVGDDYRR